MVILRRVDVRLSHVDVRPVDVELLRKNPGESSQHTLTHFRLCHQQHYAAIAHDLDPGVERTRFALAGGRDRAKVKPQ
jgi:hypothetical protein